MLLYEWQVDWGGLAERVIGWRRRLHQYPELSHQEYKTTEWLKKIIQTEFPEILLLTPAPTGIIARLPGKLAQPVVALRADIDALPVQEANHSEFDSLHPGVMHACGHDAHTAILLGTMQVLYDQRHYLNGSVIFIFQRGEEMAPGGAKELVESGCLNEVSAFFGLHLDPMLPVGNILIKPGVATANRDTFTITLQGKGGHSAMPQQCHDVLVACGQLIGALQTIIAREISPAETAVVSLCSVIAGEGSSARLPDSAKLWGVVRSFSTDIRGQIREAITRITEQIAGAFRCRGQAIFADWDYQAIINDELLAITGLNAARAVLGEQGAIKGHLPMCVGEDFSEYQNIAPVCFAWLGVGKLTGENYPLHSEYFFPNEQALIIGVKYYCQLVWSVLSQQGQ